tara:strand:- start:2331 stop:2456 length:126 start_codon:yes stop_codon:yes gene_type:complete
MSIFDFMSESPFLTAFIFFITCLLIDSIIKTLKGNDDDESI